MSLPSTPDDAALRRAFAQAWRTHWPTEYTQAMTNPVIAAIVRTVALHVPPVHHREVLQALGTPYTGPPPFIPAHPRPPTVTQPMRQLDFKSRAAGEKEDDE